MLLKYYRFELINKNEYEKVIIDLILDIIKPDVFFIEWAKYKNV